MAVQWPALLSLSGDAELLVVRDQAQWDADPHLHAAHYLPADRLIDAEGNIHRLQRGDHQPCRPQPTGEQATPDTVVALVQAHAAQAGACCVAKFSATSIRAAIAAVEEGNCLR